MRCYICDVELSEQEIKLDKQGKSEPCMTCMKIIIDTAFCDGIEPTDERFVELVEEENSEGP